MLDRLTIERMAAKAGEGPILVALSGGGDSVALLQLLQHELSGRCDVRALIVDHKLRPGSGEDAERAREIACSLGAPAAIEELHWPEGANRGHEAARIARYAALCRAARKCAAKVIVAGHTRDDQAETVLLRASRGSGLRGLGGMRAWSPMPIWPEGRGIALARPLLSVRRSELRRELRRNGTRWLEDPANLNRDYARVRARQVLEVLEEQHRFDVVRFADLAQRLAPVAEAVDEAALELVERAASGDGGEINIDIEMLAHADAEVRQRVLFALVTAAGAHGRGPASEQVAELNAAISRPNFSASTLAGALIRRRGDRLIFARDRGALEGRADGTLPAAPLILPAFVEVVWDRRVALTAQEPGWSVVSEGGALRLARGEERAALAAASPHWLLMERVRHVLGRD